MLMKKTDPSIKIIPSSVASSFHSPWPSSPHQKRHLSVSNSGYTPFHLQTYHHLSLFPTLLFQVAFLLSKANSSSLHFLSCSLLPPPPRRKKTNKNKRNTFLIMPSPQATIVSGTWNTIREYQ